MVEQLHKTGTFNLLIDPALRDAVEKAAAHDHRSVTSLVEKLLTDYLGPRGYIGAVPARMKAFVPKISHQITTGNPEAHRSLRPFATIFLRDTDAQRLT